MVFIHRHNLVLEFSDGVLSYRAGCGCLSSGRVTKSGLQTYVLRYLLCPLAHRILFAVHVASVLVI